MKNWRCAKCGHEVAAKEKPAPIKWTDLHTCYFAEDRTGPHNIEEHAGRIDRVMIDSNEARPPFRFPATEYEPDIVFIRDDGWTLGAEFKLEEAAYKTWEKEWVAFFYTKKADVPLNWKHRYFAMSDYSYHLSTRSGGTKL